MQNPSLTPNLTGIALSAGERQMGPISGGPINFSFARLSHASLAAAVGANLEIADLSDADLSDAPRRRQSERSRAVRALLDGSISQAPGSAAQISRRKPEEAQPYPAQIDKAWAILDGSPPHLARPKAGAAAARP
jgi:hypothetical protein